MAIFSAGNMVSGFGILLFLIGSGYQIWYVSPRKRLAKIRSRSHWHLLGNLTVVGMLVFVAGRALAIQR